MQTLGTVVGAILQLIIMKQIISSHRELLTDVQGNNFWSGQNVQSFNTEAVTWGALAKVRLNALCPSRWRQLTSGPRRAAHVRPLWVRSVSLPLCALQSHVILTKRQVHSTYLVIPLAVVIGLACPLPFYALHRFFPRLGADKVVVPLFVYAFGYLNAGINSQNFFCVVLAFVSQWYLRKHRSTWFRKYNFLLSAALDGGTQVFVFVAVRLALSNSRRRWRRPVRPAFAAVESGLCGNAQRCSSSLLTPPDSSHRRSPSRAAQDGPSRCREC